MIPGQPTTRRPKAYLVFVEGDPFATVYAKTWHGASGTGRSLARRRGLDVSTVQTQQSAVERRAGKDLDPGHYTPPA